MIGGSMVMLALAAAAAHAREKVRSKSADAWSAHPEARDLP